MHSQKPIWPPSTTRCHSVWHIFEPITLAKGPTFLLLIRIWFIVSFKIMMMMTKAYVWACKIRPEPVWCPSFAGWLVCTFSSAHWQPSTSLSFSHWWHFSSLHRVCPGHQIFYSLHDTNHLDGKHHSTTLQCRRCEYKYSQSGDSSGLLKLFAI